MIVRLVIACLGFFALLNFKAIAVAHPAESLMRQIEEGAETFNGPLIFRTLTDDVTMVSKNGDTVFSKKGVEDYFYKMASAPVPILKKLESNGAILGTLAETSTAVILYGTSDDHYVFTNGFDLQATTIWTSLAQKIKGEWKIRMVHFSFDLFQNQMLISIEQKALWALPLGILCGFVFVYMVIFLSRVVIRKKFSIIIGVGFFLLTLSVPGVAHEPTASPESVIRDFFVELQRGRVGDFVHEKVVFTGHDGVARVGQRAMQTEVDKLSFEIKNENVTLEPEGKQVLFNNWHLTRVTAEDSVAVGIGTLNHVILYRDQKESLPTNWTVSLFRENNRWLVASVHFSANLFENPIWDKARNRITKFFVFGFALGFLIAVGLKFFLYRRKTNRR